MRTINNKYLFFVRTIIIGFFIILVLVFDKNIERIIIAFLTYLICNTFRRKRLSFTLFRVFLIGIIIGLVIGNLFLMIHIKNQNDDQDIYYKIDNQKIGKPAVILLAKGESKNYNANNILKNLYNKEGYINKSIIAYKAFTYKLAYEKMGSSIYNDICKKTSELLQDSLGYDYDVFLTYINTYPKLTNEIEEFSKKYDRIILIPLFLYENDEYNKLLELVNNKLLHSQTELKTTSFLWESEKLAKQIALKATNNINSNNRGFTGIILIEDTSVKDIYKKKFFLNNIIIHLEKYGFDAKKILIIEKTNQKKFLKNKVNRLQEMGISRIVIINCSDIIDNIINMRGIIKTIDKIKRIEDIEIDYITGWGIGENLINELEYQTRIINLTN